MMPGVVDESRIGPRQFDLSWRQRRHGRQSCRQRQGATIVVGTVAVLTIGQQQGAMLKYAAVVRHARNRAPRRRLRRHQAV